ncbi:ABC transporter permease subunit [Paenibacillus sp. LMG 31460]|uniref:ABC transporter permease subunit n=2 Tax=Paenibacillus germinis TaxID=2654979 RepID=A0ABX1YYH7_9BACL|nr:ABC transporter permease subunit [Paenibacillus germinis]
MTIPGILLLFGFSYLPMFGIVIAFKNFKATKGIWGSEWVGIDNFRYLFGSADAWRITFNTLYLNALFIFCGTVSAVLLALLMNEVKKKWANKLLQSSLFFPYLLSWVLIGYIVFAVLKMENGLLNNWLTGMGLQPVQWYMEPRYWPAILLVVMLWKTSGYYSIIYLSAILGISDEYYEAAKIDGASKLQQIRFITLPLLTPVVTIMTLLQIGRIFYADFGLFYNVTRDSGMLYTTTDVIDTYVFRMLRSAGDVGMASAAGFYQAIVGFALVLLANLIVRKIDKENALF